MARWSRGFFLLAFALADSPGAATEPSAGEKGTWTGNDNRRVDSYGDPLPAGALARLGTQRWRHGPYVVDTVFTADGKKLLSAGGNNISHWDARTGERLGRDFPPDGIGQGRFSAKGEYFGWGSGAVQVWDIEKKTRRQFEGQFTSWVPLAFSSDAKWLAASSRDGAIHLWDLASGKEFQKLRGEHGGQIDALAVSPDAKTLAGGDQKTILLWNVNDGSLKWKSSDQVGRISGLAFSRDGQLLVSASEDGTIRLWESATGKELKLLADKVARRPVPVFSPDGRVLATTAGKEIRTFETTNWKQLHRWRAHEDEISIVAFSPDSKVIVSTEYHYGVTGCGMWQPRKSCGVMADTMGA